MIADDVISLEWIKFICDVEEVLLNQIGAEKNSAQEEEDWVMIGNASDQYELVSLFKIIDLKS